MEEACEHQDWKYTLEVLTDWCSVKWVFTHSCFLQSKISSR